MGFWGALFGSDPDAKIRKARKFLERHDYSEARLELMDLQHPEADGLMQQALDGLIRLNLEEAAARSRSGDPQGAAEHMALAQSFGAQPDQVRAIRRSMREARQAERVAKESAKQSPIQPEGSDPLWALDPENPRLRFALLLEAWPSDLQSRLVNLGPQFAEAALLLEEGKPQQAAQKLTPFVETEMAARIFRARAHLAMGNLAAAASDLHTFSQALGHRVIGKQSTAVLLTQTLGQLGRLKEALLVVETESEKLPENDPLQLPLSGSKAALLEGLGRLEEAESTCEAVVLQAPRDLGLYRMLARIREARGNRMGAMQALEGGLNTCCSSPGKCGNQPFDVHAGRTLVRLYLEDRMEPKRSEELLRELERNVRNSTWEDRYIATLTARNSADPGVERMAIELAKELPESDRRHQWLQTQFNLRAQIADSQRSNKLIETSPS